jgi:hypothetical protein
MRLLAIPGVAAANPNAYALRSVLLGKGAKSARIWRRLIQWRQFPARRNAILLLELATQHDEFVLAGANYALEHLMGLHKQSLRTFFLVPAANAELGGQNDRALIGLRSIGAHCYPDVFFEPSARDARVQLLANLQALLVSQPFWDISSYYGHVIFPLRLGHDVLKRPFGPVNLNQQNSIRRWTLGWLRPPSGRPSFSRNHKARHWLYLHSLVADELNNAACGESFTL